MDDKQLLDKIRSGQISAFDALYAKYSRSLMRYILHIVHDQASAEDIFHEAFIRVIKNLNLEFDRAKFSTWLFKVARNLAISSLRKNSRTDLDDAMDQYPGSSGSPIRIEDHEIIVEILKQISPAKREVFVLKQTQGFSYDEIAQILELPVGTVRSRLHACVKELQQLVKEQANELQ